MSGLRELQADGMMALTTDEIGVHRVWVNGRIVADADGLVDDVPLAGTLLTDFRA